MESSSPKALIAEDDSALSRVLQFTLSRGGFEVTQAMDGAAAWQHAQQEQFDIVLTDQQMPFMSGIELCSNLRAQDKHKDVPIILLTAKGLELELPQLCEDLGIAATFPKPFSPSQVLTKVQELTADSPVL